MKSKTPKPRESKHHRPSFKPEFAPAAPPSEHAQENRGLVSGEEAVSSETVEVWRIYSDSRLEHFAGSW